jgi:hypothetical protein
VAPLDQLIRGVLFVEPRECTPHGLRLLVAGLPDRCEQHLRIAIETASERRQRVHRRRLDVARLDAADLRHRQVAAPRELAHRHFATGRLDQLRKGVALHVAEHHSTKQSYLSRKATAKLIASNRANSTTRD